MKKTIDISKLELALNTNSSKELKLGYLYLYLNSDHAGVVKVTDDLRHGLSEFSGLMGSIWISSLFQSMGNLLTFKDDLIIIRDYIDWTYGYLKPDYNPHAKAWAAIDKHGLKYSKNLNQVTHSNL